MFEDGTIYVQRSVENLNANPSADLLKLSDDEFSRDMLMIDTPDAPRETRSVTTRSGKILTEPVKVDVPKPTGKDDIYEYIREQAIENTAYEIAKKEYDIASSVAKVEEAFAWRREFRQQLFNEGYPLVEVLDILAKAGEARALEDTQMAEINAAKHKSEIKKRLGEVANKPPIWPKES